MRNRIQFPLMACLAISLFFDRTAFSIPVRSGQAASPAFNLESILAKAADYCRRLEASVLDFVCSEKVVEKVDRSRETTKPLGPQHDWNWMRGQTGTTVYSSMRPAKNTFLYDYQCVRADRVLKERRTLIELNGKKHNDPDSQLLTTSVAFRNALLGPVNLFSAKSQHQYDFRLTGTDKLDKRRVVIIEAAPKTDSPEPLCLTGKAWVDPETGNIHKIEWTQKPSERADLFVEREQKIEGKLRLTLRTEFHAEKNGLRFPSRLSIEEAYINKRGRAFVRSTTEVAYTDFKFFTVEVDVR
jgi:hypothetical protein